MVVNGKLSSVDDHVFRNRLKLFSLRIASNKKKTCQLMIIGRIEAAEWSCYRLLAMLEVAVLAKLEAAAWSC